MLHRTNKKTAEKRYFEHLNAYKKPDIYKSNLATHAINTGHEFPDIINVTLIKHISVLLVCLCGATQRHHNEHLGKFTNIQT